MYKGNNTISSVIKGSSNIAKILFNGIEVWRKSLLPDGYTLCDYLESTGTQYIDTGINPDQNTKVECVANWAFSATNINGENPNPTLYGARSNTGSFYEVLQGANKVIYYQYGSISPNITGDTVFDRKAKYLTDGNKFYIDDTLKITAKASTFTNMQSMCIFCLNNQGTIERFSLAKMYYFKVYDNGVLVQNLIPCLDNNRTPCMYDTVSGKTFYNKGTGEFKWSINATYLQLKDFVEGFVNSSTGAIAFNPTYPRAISSPLVLFEKDKFYKITSNLSATKTDDGVRFRIYGTDDSYKMSLGASQITTNAYATFEALDYAGKANFYVAKEILITPKQDFKARIMYIDSNYVSKFKIEENLM